MSNLIFYLFFFLFPFPLALRVKRSIFPNELSVPLLHFSLPILMVGLLGFLATLNYTLAKLVAIFFLIISAHAWIWCMGKNWGIFKEQLRDNFIFFMAAFILTIIYCYYYGDHAVVSNGDILSQSYLAALVKMDNSFPLVNPLNPEQVYRITYPPALFVSTAIFSGIFNISIQNILLYFWYLSFMATACFLFEKTLFLFQNKWLSFLSAFLIFLPAYTYAYHDYGMPQKLFALLFISLSVRVYAEYITNRSKETRPYSLVIMSAILFALISYFHTLFSFFGAFVYAGILLVLISDRSLWPKQIRFFLPFSILTILIVFPYISKIPLSSGVSGAGGGSDHVVYNLFEAFTPFYSNSGTLLFVVGLIVSLFHFDLKTRINMGHFLGLLHLSQNHRFYNLLGFSWYNEFPGKPHHNLLPTSTYYIEKFFPFLTHHMLVMNGFNLIYLTFVAYILALVFQKKDYFLKINPWVFLILFSMIILSIKLPEYLPWVHVPLWTGLALYSLSLIPPSMSLKWRELPLLSHLTSIHLQLKRPIPKVLPFITGCLALVFVLIYYRLSAPFFMGSFLGNGNKTVGQQEQELLSYLKKNTGEDDLILNNNEIHHFNLFTWWVGSLAERKTVCTRPIHTKSNMMPVNSSFSFADYQEKLYKIFHEIVDPSDTEYFRLLSHFGVKYILWFNVKLPNPVFHSSNLFQLVFKNHRYTLYKFDEKIILSENRSFQARN